MLILKGGLWGIIGGLFYAFVSFYLLTPIFRVSFASIIYYGIQGFLYGISLQFLRNYIFIKNNNKLFTSFIIGAISGLISSSLNITITIYNTLIMHNSELAQGFKIQLLKEIIYYEIGCILLGAILALLLSKAFLEKKAEDKPS